ncbi:Uncharacterised protein [Chromobacterium violaceum]|uniref:Uncharacterized protein n=1 Tax=Chromobacterium violaceum TaxID=536 RepID=A0A447TEM8_CHRVL|nr:Uncharacterised protein [Chromobacterium violaceum]
MHFSLIHQGKAEPVNRKWLGGWQFFSGGRAYQGYAARNGSRVNVGGRLTHYSGGSDPRRRRAVPAASPRRAAATAASTCAAAQPERGNRRQRGARRTGGAAMPHPRRGGGRRLGRTDIWNRTASGHWISDGFIDTGSNAPVVPPCPSSARPW